ncbi:MAG: hypothetical protein ACTSSE_17210 [Candidatus Thorarchaeota archaeon]
MLINQGNGQDLYPEWTSTSGLELWQPSDFYIEWLAFLNSIWQKVDYL